MDRPAEPAHQVRKAFFNILASSTLFAVLTVLVKDLSKTLHPFEVVFFRTAINFTLLMGILIFYRKGGFQNFLGAPKKRTLMIRGFFGTTGVTFLFLSIERLPVSIASLLNWSSPLFVLIFSGFFLGERVPKKAWGFIAFAFLGLLFLIEPFGPRVDALSVSGLLFGLLGAASGGAAFIAIRSATAKVGAEVIVAWYTGIATVLSFPLMCLHFTVPSKEAWPKILAMGVIGSAAQLFMTQGYRFAPAGIVSVMGLMTAGVSALLGYLIFGEILDLTQWVGLLILACGVAGTARVR